MGEIPIGLTTGGVLLLRRARNGSSARPRAAGWGLVAAGCLLAPALRRRAGLPVRGAVRRLAAVADVDLYRLHSSAFAGAGRD